MSTTDATAWHAVAVNDVLKHVQSDRNGLTAVEAKARLKRDGRNELGEAKPIRPATIFFAQFKSLAIGILIAAGIISGLLGEWIDCAAILAIVVLNAVIGFYQEWNAERSIAALKKITAPRGNVYRDGHVISIPAAEIVRGDIIELHAGDLVPADARLLEAASLKCSESALTGESTSVAKNASTICTDQIAVADRSNMVFMGTSVSAGTGCAVIVATAMRTELGHIATLIEQTTDEATPLQQKLAAFARILVWASLAIIILLFLLGLWRGTPLFELFLTSISLAVAAIPEGLPAVVTVALALGVLRMSRRAALVRKLPAVETLGSTNVICTDKTGTLTVGEMTVRSLFVAGALFDVTGEGYDPSGRVLIEGKDPTSRQAAPLLDLASILVLGTRVHLRRDVDNWVMTGEPTEGALFIAGLKSGVNAEYLATSQPIVRELPFDSDRKRSTIIRQTGDNMVRAFVNGAPDQLLEHCSHIRDREGVRLMTDGDRRLILARNGEMGRSGLRVLGSAFRNLSPEIALQNEIAEIEHDLVFVGLAGMQDPARLEAKQAIAKCRDAGIRVVMITGDHPETALAIARELKIAKEKSEVLTGVEIDALSEDALRNRIDGTAVFARVSPEHKLRIVRAWKACDAVVAMTGDGVNDAPAIKAADIGIAMGRTGTEVTKQAADIIIADDNFASIVAAVEQGRGIYDNIRKTLQYLLAGNSGELLLMTVCAVFGLPAPLLPIHLLWINLVTDGLPAICLATDPIDPDVMRRSPRRASEKLTAHGFYWKMLITGALTATVSLYVFLDGLHHESLDLARTHAFTVLVFAELFRSFGARSETKPILKIPFLTNLQLLWVVGISIGLQILSQHNTVMEAFLKASNVPWGDLIVLLPLSLIPVLVLEVMKLTHRSTIRATS